MHYDPKQPVFRDAEGNLDNRCGRSTNLLCVFEAQNFGLMSLEIVRDLAPRWTLFRRQSPCSMVVIAWSSAHKAADLTALHTALEPWRERDGWYRVCPESLAMLTIHGLNPHPQE